MPESDFQTVCEIFYHVLAHAWQPLHTLSMFLAFGNVQLLTTEALDMM